MSKSEEFNALATTQLGKVGENWLKEYLRSIGYTDLWWNDDNHPTLCDGIGISGFSQSVKTLFECKTKTKNQYGNYSIAKNDLIRYEKLSITMGMQLVVCIIDYESGELNCITTTGIRENTFTTEDGRTEFKDPQDGKPIYYFSGYKRRAQIPIEVVTDLRKLAINSKNENNDNRN